MDITKETKNMIISTRPLTIEEHILKKILDLKVAEISRNKELELKKLFQQYPKINQVKIDLFNDKLKMYETIIEDVKKLNEVDETAGYNMMKKLKEMETYIENTRQSELFEVESLYKEKYNQIFRQANDDINKLYEDYGNIIKKKNEDFYSKYIEEKTIIESLEKDLYIKKESLQKKYTRHNKLGTSWDDSCERNEL